MTHPHRTACITAVLIILSLVISPTEDVLAQDREINRGEWQTHKFGLTWLLLEDPSFGVLHEHKYTRHVKAGTTVVVHVRGERLPENKYFAPRVYITDPNSSFDLDRVTTVTHDQRTGTVIATRTMPKSGYVIIGVSGSYQALNRSYSIFVDERAPVRSSTWGIQLSAGYGSASMSMAEYDDSDSGGAFYGRVAVPLSHALSLYTEGEYSSLTPLNSVGEGTYTLYHLETGLRFLFLGQSSRFRPYMQAGAGFRRISTSEDQGYIAGDLDGWHWAPGLGLEFFVTPTVSLDFGGTRASGEFFRARVDGGDFVDLEDFAFSAQSMRWRLGASVRL